MVYGSAFIWDICDEISFFEFVLASIGYHEVAPIND